MTLKEQINRVLEALFLAMFMVWTVGVTIELVTPRGARDHHGVVEIYSLSAVAGANSGA